MNIDQEFSTRMIAALAAFGIPADRLRANPSYEVHPGGITLEPRFFVSFDEITEEQRAALYELTGLEDLR